MPPDNQIMRSDNQIKRFLKNNRQYLLLLAIAMFSYILFESASSLQNTFSRIVGIATYLTWHNLFELFSILISFAVFFVSYYSYSQSGNLRSIFLGSVFMLIGFIDLFHTLSFKGMPDFLIPNTGANRATTFWIVARLLGSIGFFVAGMIPVNRKASLKRVFFLIIPIIVSLSILIAATYLPGLFPPMYIEGKGLTGTKLSLEYIVMFLLAAAVIKFVLEYNRTKDFLIVLFSGSLVLRIFSEFAFTHYNQVYDIYNYLGHVYKILAYFIVFRVMFVYSVQKPYLELEAARDEIKNYADNLDRIVEERTKEIKQINQKLMEDLEYAKDIQRAILPSKLPEEKEICFSARYFPAEHVSGDFYNVFKLDDDNIGLYIGDVSGHGVPSAMLSVFLTKSIKPFNQTDDGHIEIYNPSSVLKNVYNLYRKTNFKDEVYAIMLYAIYNTKSRKLTYASAGLNAEPLILKASKSISRIEIKGFPICRFLDNFEADYTDAVICLDSGDRVLFYTDGLVEAENPEGKSFSGERLSGLLKNSCDRSCSELAEIVTRDVFNFLNSTKLKDDITFLVMEVK